MFRVAELITDAMTVRNWNQSDLASVTGRSKQYVSDILNGKRSFDAEAAVLFGAALDLSAEELLLLDIREKLSVVESSLNVEAIKYRSFVESHVNLRLLQEDGVLDAELDLNQVLKVLEPTEQIISATKRRGSGTYITPKQASWLAAVQLQVEAQAPNFPPFQQDGLQELAASIPAKSADLEWFKQLPILAAKVGVILVSKRVFPGAALHGAAFRVPVGNSFVPVIALTAKGGRADSVVFTLLHEIGHHLLGHVNDICCINVTHTHDSCESEADSFASRMIGTDRIVNYPNRPSRQWITDAADSLEIPEWFIIGHLQNAGIIPWGSPMSRNIPNIQEVVLSWQPVYSTD